MKSADVVTAVQTTVFLAGPPGSGKTTLGVQRLDRLLRTGVPAEQVLVLVPHRALATPYYESIASPQHPAGRRIDITTVGGIARRSVELFWPLIAHGAGFGDTILRPRFLTLETAQYSMDHIIQPYIEAGAFDGVTVSRARLVSQIIDNLNKAAAVGFPVDEISSRLGRAWAGESARLRLFGQVQEVAKDFRAYCLSEGLLDWSLQIELLTQQMLPLPQFRRYLLSGYRHLIVDNVEEDIPVAHDLLQAWLPLAESALLIYDEEGGHRVFLGADPNGGKAVAKLCGHRVSLRASHVPSSAMIALGRLLSDRSGETVAVARLARQALVLPPEPIRFHTQMLDWVAQEVSRLISETGVAPGEVAILAPFVSDALRFSMEERTTRYGVSLQTHRPSRQLREEPAVGCLLTLSKLAHPFWGCSPPPEDVAQALCLAIAGMDPVRAFLLVMHAYHRGDGRSARLADFRDLSPALQERISHLLGGRYTELVNWIRQWIPQSPESGAPTHGSVWSSPLDFFLSRLFTEILTQPGFGFRHNFGLGSAAATLIQSAREFRAVTAPVSSTPSLNIHLGAEYVKLVEHGVLAAQHAPGWPSAPKTDAVLLVPAYTFLMLNRPVTFQFWLDVGSHAWHERIFQPLTHPYVLQRSWPEEAVWTDEEEERSRGAALARLVLGLCYRCRQKVYSAYCDLNERGYEQQGPLLQSVQRLLRSLYGGRT